MIYQTNFSKNLGVQHTIGMDREGRQIAIIDKNLKVLLDATHFPLGNIRNSTLVERKSAGFNLPKIETLDSYIKEIFTGARVIVYNAKAEIANAPAWFQLASEVICVMERAAHLGGKWNYQHNSYEWITLTKAIETAGIEKPVGFPHHAVADARATMLLWHFLEERDNRLAEQHFPERLTRVTNSGRS